MPHWLCTARSVQQTRSMMRFDPAYWTVNFARPHMAAVTTTGPESLRVDGVFYTRDALTGLIWESEDRLDHPLLSYDTNRDYRGLTLSFRWQSSGLKPLDAINGPTLTIEGRDANGTARSWYVRLWNYAQGAPEDAQVTLDFSALDGGFLLPQEADPVYAGDIDRMFISLVPPEYDGTSASLPAAAEGWAELSQIRTDGAGAHLLIGDVMLPEHRLKMATGYDDSYNQTPERLVRNIHALGYRGVINHYVGMSHYFRLEPNSGGHYVSLAGGALNTACRAWHLDFAQRAKSLDHPLIFSLSYELFDAHCWNDWKQRAENGEPALTGWVPPSTLLSPANSGAMAYLQAVARAFVAIQKQAGQPALFQVGEPWWWIMPDGRICLYDAAANAAFGGLSVSIANIGGAKTPAQQAMLDKAGEILSASTAALVTAAKDEAGTHPFTSHLLVYLPTVLDDDAPDTRRANVPVGWASPAFDVLQLEDYDWVTEGNHAATRKGVAAATQRLGYPVAAQHYFTGFVLRPEDSAQWGDIAQAASDAFERDAAAVFVWAEPQVSRDGFTYFETGDDMMQAFDDVTFPIAIGRQATATARFSTQVITALSGQETRNSDWADARMTYDVSPGVRGEEERDVLLSFFRARRGPARAFRFSDPFDSSSASMRGQPSATDQLIGTGDGVTTRFALVKHYGEGEMADPQTRRITRPVPGSLSVAIDGAVVTDWEIEAGGFVNFSTPPAAGAAITAGYRFDVPVRFTSDLLDIGDATFQAGDMPAVELIEVKETDA